MSVGEFSILMNIPDPTGCGLYRAILPAAECGRIFTRNNIPIKIYVSASYEIPNRYFDAYIFHRVPPLEKIPHILKLIDKGSRVIWEMDDDLWEIPEWSPSKKFFGKDILKWLSIFLENSESVIASTGPLADEIRARVPGKDVVVLKNLIHSAYFKDISYKSKPDSPVTKLLYTGSNTHAGDTSPLADVAEKYRDEKNVYMIFYGHWPPEVVKKPAKNFVMIGFTRLESYGPTLCFMAPDVSFVPLSDHKFNKSKSNIKFMETTLAGAACIVSESEAYADLVDSVHAVKIPSLDGASWVEATESLIKDPEKRISMNEEARKLVIGEYSWETPNENRSAWLRYFASLAGIELDYPSLLE